MKLPKNAYADLLGAQIVAAENGRAEVSLTTKNEHTNRLGYVHGGLLYSLADIAFEAASNSHPEDAVSIATDMRFFYAVKEGQKLIAKATESHLGRKTATYLVNISSEGKLLATFTGTVYRLKNQQQ